MPKPLQITPITVGFLFLDQDTCAPCGGTAQTLAQAVKILHPLLKALSIKIVVNHIHISSKEIAITQQLVSSPTIRINGVDLDPSLSEANCETCGTIAGNDTKVNCRIWEWHDKTYTALPLDMILIALMNAALHIKQPPIPSDTSGCCIGPVGTVPYRLPENIEGFFKARDKGCA